MKNIMIIIIIVLLSLAYGALGISEVTLNDVKRPSGAVLFIVDGLGSSYYYPEIKPYSLEGSELLKASSPNLTFGARVIDIRTSNPVTGIAHSVIVTGDSKAEEEIVGFTDATIFDVTRQHGFVNLAVMEKGDFFNMREEQDIIMYAENNSIDEPVISIYAKNPLSDINALMYDWKAKLPVYLNNKSGAEKYASYNKWGIDAANAVMSAMTKNHPSQKFLLTVNVGAVDAAGHNLGDDDYVRVIESLDRDFYPLYTTASQNNIALFFTADHGMSFARKNAKRGGHAGEKYSSRQESLRIPLVVASPNTIHGTISGEYGQEDIAPTILNVLDLPNHLQYGDGQTINVKNYASIFIKADTEYTVSLWNDGRKVSENSDAELIFAGLPLNTNYTLKATGAGGTYEEHIVLDSDKQITLSNRNVTGINRRMTAIFLIMVVMIAGFMVIKRIKD